MATTELVRTTDYTIDDVRSLLQSKGGVQPSDLELQVFVKTCQTVGANPLLNDMHLIKYSNNSPASYVTGKDFYTKKARANGASWIGGVIVLRTIDGQRSVVKESGSFVLPDDQLVGGWASVSTPDGPFESSVSMEEYSSNQSTWKKMPATMIRKVALVHALREAYPDVFSGLYDYSEMQQKFDEQGIDLGTMVEDEKTTIIDSTPKHSSPIVNHAQDMGATIVSETVMAQEPTPQPQIVQTPEPIVPEKQDSITCPLHGKAMNLRSGNFGDYYSHPEEGYKKGWCNCTEARPSGEFTVAWLNVISEAHGSELATQVESIGKDQDVAWWINIVNNGLSVNSNCIQCGSQGDVVVSGQYYCVADAPDD